jgi:transposase-like protein
MSNMPERANLEPNRIASKIGALPNDRPLLSLAVAILINIDEEWQAGKRYLNMEAMSWIQGRHSF